MATHSSVLAWRIPGTGEPGGLLSMGSHGVGHDCSDLAAAAITCIKRAIDGKNAVVGFIPYHVSFNISEMQHLFKILKVMTGVERKHKKKF